MASDIRLLQSKAFSSRSPQAALAAVFLFVSAGTMVAQDLDNTQSTVRRSVSRDLLSDAEWQRVEVAVDRGLAFLSRQRLPKGSYQSNDEFEPGITGLCSLAFLSRGHLPGQGPYGDELEATIQYIVGCQRTNGMIADRVHVKYATYSHPIGALVLSELYGMAPITDEDRIRTAINKAIHFTSLRVSQPKVTPGDEGSWRYLERHNNRDGDLSITSWNMVFLRSAKNAGFDVNAELIEEGLAYVKRLYSPKNKTFYYLYNEPEVTQRGLHRSMAGAGILSLALAGEHHSEMAKTAARFLLDHPYTSYEIPRYNPREYLAYGAFYSSVGMFQMGGEYWDGFYPQFIQLVLKAQHPDGSWYSDRSKESAYGHAYVTALTILALTPPYQMLPVFQR